MMEEQIIQIKQKAEEYANQSQYTDYDNPSLSESLDISQDIKKAYIAGATENGIDWNGNVEPEEHKEIIARSQYGCTLIASYFDNAWRNVWNGGKLDFEKDVACWAYVKLPKE